jgi:hypothetical protein
MAGRTACPLRGAVRAEMTLALATTHQHVTRFTHLVTSHQRDETPQRPRPTTAPIVNTTDSSLARADPVITARNPCHEPICMSPSGVSRFFTVFTHILLDTRPPFFCSRAYRALYFFFGLQVLSLVSGLATPHVSSFVPFALPKPFSHYRISLIR